VVVYELETGIAKSTGAAKRRSQLDQLLKAVAVVPFGIEEAKAAAAIRARLEQDGAPIGPMDTLIAGTALAHGGVLVTRNIREFGRVPGLRVGTASRRRVGRTGHVPLSAPEDLTHRPHALFKAYFPPINPSFPRHARTNAAG
jgi:tRNA(fMet)-specific endonuclease VapC